MAICALSIETSVLLYYVAAGLLLVTSYLHLTTGLLEVPAGHRQLPSVRLLSCAATALAMMAVISQVRLHSAELMIPHSSGISSQAKEDRNSRTLPKWGL